MDEQDKLPKIRVNITLSPAAHQKAKDDSKKQFGGLENTSAYIQYLIMMNSPKAK